MNQTNGIISNIEVSLTIPQDVLHELSWIAMPERNQRMCVCDIIIIYHWTNKSFIFWWFSSESFSYIRYLGNHPFPCITCCVYYQTNWRRGKIDLTFSFSSFYYSEHFIFSYSFHFRQRNSPFTLHIHKKYIYMYICTYIDVHTYIHTYIYIYIHVHTYILLILYIVWYRYTLSGVEQFLSLNFILYLLSNFSLVPHPLKLQYSTESSSFQSSTIATLIVTWLR